MEKKLNFVLKPSLEEMALRRVVVNLWNEPDVLTSIANFRIKNPSDDWLEQVQRYLADKRKHNKELHKIIENKLKDKVTKLILPESLKKRMMHLVRPIGLEILRWKMWTRYLNIIDSPEDWDINILKQLCWTSTGAIDYQKTIENLVRLDIFQVEKKFELACRYCLLDKIPVLWEELPEQYKNRINNKYCHSQKLEKNLILYWSHFLKGKDPELHNIVPRQFSGNLSIRNQYFGCLEFSAFRGNKAATEHLLQKLTYEERDSHLLSLVETVIIGQNLNSQRHFFEFRNEQPADVLCYLLSLMNPEMQMHVLKDKPCDVLTCFLYWPLQDLFLDVADLIWTFLPERQYSALIENIKGNITYSGYYFPKLFQKFFLGSPNEFRKRLVSDASQLGSFFIEFFNADDAETIEVIFRNIDAEDRVRLVSSVELLQHFDNLIMKGNRRLVEVCLREAKLSEEDKGRLKRGFSDFLIHCSKITGAESKERRRKQFFELLDETDASAQSKRRGDTEQTRQ